MKKILIFLLALSLCACAAPQNPTTSSTAATTSSVTSLTTQPTTLPPEPVYVYENAEENYLLPFDEYSWER